VKPEGTGELDCDGELVNVIIEESSIPDMHPPSLNRIHGAYMMLRFEKPRSVGIRGLKDVSIKPRKERHRSNEVIERCIIPVWNLYKNWGGA
jgi:hypothetical protein